MADRRKCAVEVVNDLGGKWSPDLDAYAAAAWSLAYEVALHDLDLSAALADFLTFAGLTAEEVTP
jgi:hypothetical protein